LIRLHLVVEGQTEETFVRDILVPEFAPHGILADVHRITTSKRGRGGFLRYQHLRRDLTLWMKQDHHPDSWFSTMVDLYRLPGEFPGLEECRRFRDPIERACYLEKCLGSDLAHPRFVPYIQVHEFEALLFSDPACFAIAFPNSKNAIGKLAGIRQAFPTPEYIDDGERTSPAKRICAVLPGYVKPVSGPIIARKIGLAALCRECTHFSAWIEALKSCVAAQS
jgi:hypothetical protein